MPDAFSRRIVGWRAHTTMRTDVVLDALEQALHNCETDGPLVHHSDRWTQYVSMRYTERVAAAGVGLFEAEMIHRSTGLRFPAMFEEQFDRAGAAHAAALALT